MPRYSAALGDLGCTAVLGRSSADTSVVRARNSVLQLWMFHRSHSVDAGFGQWAHGSGGRLQLFRRSLRFLSAMRRQTASQVEGQHLHHYRRLDPFTWLVFMWLAAPEHHSSVHLPTPECTHMW